MAFELLASGLSRAYYCTGLIGFGPLGNSGLRMASAMQRLQNLSSNKLLLPTRVAEVTNLIGQGVCVRLVMVALASI
jgi:hypothetical protein